MNKKADARIIIAIQFGTKGGGRLSFVLVDMKYDYRWICVAIGI